MGTECYGTSEEVRGQLLGISSLLGDPGRHLRCQVCVKTHALPVGPSQWPRVVFVVDIVLDSSMRRKYHLVSSLSSSYTECSAMPGAAVVPLRPQTHTTRGRSVSTQGCQHTRKEHLVASLEQLSQPHPLPTSVLLCGSNKPL